MYARNAFRWSRFSTLESLGGTLLLTASAFVIKSYLMPFVQPFGIFHFFTLSCLATQFFFGYRYALMGLVLSIFLGEYFFVEPFGTFDELTAKDVIITLNFVSATLAAVYLIEKLHRSAYAGELLLKVTQSRQLISLQRENDRLHYARKSSEAWSVLTLFISDFDRVILFQYDHEPPRLGPLFYQLAHQPIEEIEPNDWLTAIHPDDRDSLLNCLRVESTTRYKTTPLRVRFTADAGQHELAVELQILRFTFMNKPLWILSER